MNRFLPLLLLVVALGTYQSNYAQTPAVDIPLTLSDNAGGSATLRFGLAPSASDGIDAGLGESELPPFPPAGVFEARFVGEDISLPQLGQGSYRDYRAGDAGFNGVKTHELRYQVGTGTTITISWNFPASVTGQLQDLFGGVVVNQTMTGAGNFVVSNPGGISKLKMSLTYAGAPQESLTLLGPDGGELWANCSRQKITWTASGFSKVKVEFSSNNGAAWTTLTDTATAALGGYAWTISSPLSTQCKVRLSDASDGAPNDVSATPFAIVNANSAPLDLPIVVTDLAGGTKTLRLGLHPAATDGIDAALGESEQPPAPPSGIFDARLVGDDIALPQLGQGTLRDYRAGAADFSGVKTYEVKYQTGAGTSIKISWDLPSGVTGVLQDVITGAIVNQPMIGNGSFTLTNPGALNKLKMTLTYVAASVAPAAPVLVSPSDNATNVSLNPTLSWNAATGANAYRVQVSTSVAFTTTVIDQTNVVTTTFAASGLQSNTKYYWRVSAANNCGEGAFANARNFTTVSNICDPQVCAGAAIFSVAQGVTAAGQIIKAKDGTTVCIDIRLKQNPQPVDAFGFKLQVDPRQLTFVSVEKGNLTANFQSLSAQETPAGSGSLTCGGFGTTAIPANSAGVLMRLCFTVNCNTVSASDIVLSAPTDDIAGFTMCCNRFECVTCVRDGDVNGDRSLTPGDALCAFQIYLNNGNVPSGCDASGFDCEVTASDVNCDNTTTPGDALAIFSRYLQNLPPLECFARTAAVAMSAPRAPYQLTLDARTVVSSESNQELVKVIIHVANPRQLSAFGVQLHYPAERLELLGVTRGSLTASWIQLEAQKQEAGVVRIGGFNDTAIATDSAGDLLEIIFAGKGREVALDDFHLAGLVDDFAQAQIHGASTGVAEQSNTPLAFKLYQSFPNPFKHGARGNAMLIRFDLPGNAGMPVELAIYNVAGQLVRRLVSGERRPGAYESVWDGKDERGQFVPSGTYWYRLKADNRMESKQLMIVR